MREVIELTGKEAGPTSVIFAGVHGDERCGIEAFERLLPTLKIKSGRVIFVYANPRAIKKNVRFTEANLNRMFKGDNKLSKRDKISYEYKRAQFLKKYLEQADVLLDIHASSNKWSKKFVIAESNALHILKKLPFNLVVFGFDRVEPGGTDYYMNSIGKIGITIECGYAKDKNSTKVAEESIKSFLRVRGHIAGKIKLYSQSHIRMYKLYLTTTNNFTLAKSFKDFQKISKGEVIGIDGLKKVKSSKKSIILFPHDIKKIGGEAFLLGEKVK